MVQLEGFLGRILGLFQKNGSPLMKNVLKPLGKNVLTPSGLKASASATHIDI